MPWNRLLGVGGTVLRLLETLSLSSFFSMLWKLRIYVSPVSRFPNSAASLLEPGSLKWGPACRRLLSEGWVPSELGPQPSRTGFPSSSGQDAAENWGPRDRAAGWILGPGSRGKGWGREVGGEKG